MSEPTLPETVMAAQAGFRTVKTPNGWVYKPFAKRCMCDFKGEIKKNLRVLDEQNAIHRYVWYDLPPGLDGELIERMLYLRGQLAFFYLEPLNRFYCLPYALAGDIDVYGRYLKITPLIFAGSKNGGQGKDKSKPFINGFKKTPYYEIPDQTDPQAILKAISDGAVIVRDYTQQIGESIIPRSVMMDGVLEMMAECLPMARTALIASSGVKGMRVGSDDEKEEVKDANDSIMEASLTGQINIPIKGMQEFQELGAGSTLKVEDFLVDMQALDNFRLSLHGLDSGGLFQKKSHMLESEQAMNETRSRAALQDGLLIRQRACDIINGIWGLGVSCEISETAMGLDRSGDGVPDDSQDQSGYKDGQQPEEGGEYGESDPQ